MTKIGSAAFAALVSTAAFASGFGLYEASAPTYALGGAVVGKAYDASANFYNPATLSDFTNIVVTVGFVTEHPRARIKVQGNQTANMNAGPFLLPHFHTVIPLPWRFSFGLGIMPEYGLGSAYDDKWALGFNSTDTTIQSVTINPNLAYAITDDWSIGAGLRFLWFDFEQYSHPFAQLNNYSVTQRLKGDNKMKSLGWQVGTRYRILDNLAVGLVYKSRTTVDVDGTSGMNYPYASNGGAETQLILPQSITFGANWDITDTVHLGSSVAWTEWSSVGTLDFHLGNVHKPVYLKWKDTVRASIAPSWDFAEDWTLLSSYTYENDCCDNQDSTMLPPSDRHMLAAGLTWRCWRGLEISACYGLILMDGKWSDVNQRSGTRYRYCASRGITHAAGLTLTYRF